MCLSVLYPQWILLLKGLARGPTLGYAGYTVAFVGIQDEHWQVEAPRRLAVRKPIYQSFAQIYLTPGPLFDLAPTRIPGCTALGQH